MMCVKTRICYLKKMEKTKGDCIYIVKKAKYKPLLVYGSIWNLGRINSKDE